MFSDLATVEAKEIRAIGVNLIFDQSRYVEHRKVNVCLTIVYGVNNSQDFKTEITVEQGDLFVANLTKHNWQEVFSGNVIFQAIRHVEENENGMDILMASISDVEF